jgi:hypothetical protein
MQATATIPTANAKRYLGQFCKHFAHKLPVELDPDLAAGKVQFGAGICNLRAGDETLSMTISGDTETDIAALRNVVQRHLIRFAFREEMALDWKLPG